MPVLLLRDYRCGPLPVLADVDAEAPVNAAANVAVNTSVEHCALEVKDVS
jgi:hypothetical protein